MSMLTSNPPYVQRISEVYNAPTLDSNNRPTNWAPASTTREPWGRVRVVINGVDRTFIRDAPVQILSWSSNEPFGDANARLAFPMLTPFDDFETWIPEFAEITIQRILPNETAGQVLFAGLVVDYSHQSTQADFNLEVEVLGSFYRVDFRHTQPMFPRIEEDLGRHIAMSYNFLRYAMQYPMGAMNQPVTGIRAVSTTYTPWMKFASEYFQERLAQMRSSNGESWTISCEANQPSLHLKDRTTVHWTVRAGQPGVELRLERDLVRPNTIFGEGTDEQSCHWRNSKYPNLALEAPPVWPGFNLTIDTNDLAVAVWKIQMATNGYNGVTSGHIYTAQDAAECRRFQQVAGITVNGVVGPQTWTATFAAGDNAGDLDAAWVAPLYGATYAEPGLYTASGGYIGLNPEFDPSRPRIDGYVNYGVNASKPIAVEDAQRTVEQNEDPGWIGSITLHADPNEGSRLEIRAGQNIRVQGYHGDNLLLHIAKATVDYQSLSTTLQVDTHARDLVTLTAQLQRDRDALAHPAASRRMGRRVSTTVEDTHPIWDCESGAGRVHRMGQAAGLWNVVRVAAAQYGQVAQCEFHTDDPTELSVAIFDRPIVANTLHNHGRPDRTDFWKDMPEEWGLLIGWGGEGQMGGYYPGRQSDTDPLTGRLVDRSSWYYHSSWPPWLWVATWTASTTYLQGRLFPGSTSGGNLPITGTLVVP